ncbi:hypothetical protein EMIT0P218_250012 [Pseudomonas sp. IT-P218]
MFASDPVGLFKVRQCTRDLEQSIGCSPADAHKVETREEASIEAFSHHSFGFSLDS